MRQIKDSIAASGRVYKCTHWKQITDFPGLSPTSPTAPLCTTTEPGDRATAGRRVSTAMLALPSLSKYELGRRKEGNALVPTGCTSEVL